MSKSWYGHYIAIFGNTIELYRLCLYAHPPSDYFLTKRSTVTALDMIAPRYCIRYEKLVGYAIYGLTGAAHPLMNSFIFWLMRRPRVGGYFK